MSSTVAVSKKVTLYSFLFRNTPTQVQWSELCIYMKIFKLKKGTITDEIKRRKKNENNKIKNL